VGLDAGAATHPDPWGPRPHPGGRARGCRPPPVLPFPLYPALLQRRRNGLWRLQQRPGWGARGAGGGWRGKEKKTNKQKHRTARVRADRALLLPSFFSRPRRQVGPPGPLPDPGPRHPPLHRHHQLLDRGQRRRRRDARRRGARVPRPRRRGRDPVHRSRRPHCLPNCGHQGQGGGRLCGPGLQARGREHVGPRRVCVRLARRQGQALVCAGHGAGRLCGG